MSVPDRSSEHVPWDAPVVRAVLLATAVAPLGVPLVSPALPAFRDQFLLSDAQASLLVSTYFLAGIVLSPFLGAFADRYGRRRLLVSSLVVFSLAGASIAAAPPFWAVIAVRVVQGTAAAGLFVSTVTLVGDTFEGVQRNAVLGVNTAVLSAAAALYPVVGGLLVGFSWNAPFLAYLLALPVAAVAWRVLPAEVSFDQRPGYLVAMARVATSSGSLGFYGATFVTEFLLFGAVFTALPFLLVDQFALSAVAVGLVITAAEVVSTVAAALNGRFARRASNATIVRAGIGVYAVGLLVVPFTTSPLGVAAGASIAGGGVGLVLPSVDAGLTDRVPADLRAGALSLRNSVTFLGRASGPIAFAAFAGAVGYDALFTTAGFVAFAVVALATAVLRLRG
ncbi:MFS transporter [Halobacterium wangiae]|uniref:MFS transporter n=1 Tax=Halobacterium wangiae TaxID=2902623 RepID=UPI001E4B09A3|nr:MFS transporter [Halobacterium wangiae]